VAQQLTLWLTFLLLHHDHSPFPPMLVSRARRCCGADRRGGRLHNGPPPIAHAVMLCFDMKEGDGEQKGKLHPQAIPILGSVEDARLIGSWVERTTFTLFYSLSSLTQRVVLQSLLL
jgi:hypothetical protein